MTRKKRSSTSSDRDDAESASDIREGANAPLGEVGQFMTDMVSNVAQNAWQWAQVTGSAPSRIARVLLLDKDARDELKPDKLQMLADTGAYLKDARKVAGLTLDELGQAMDLKDKSLLQAVEAGTATLSFDLILRLASLLARHDPLPFVMRMARAHNPRAWDVMDKWGLGRASKQLERERRFINILRQHDEVRELSDEEFERICAFTNEAFSMALAFRAGEDEPIPD
ncbi:MAG: helix-turn-helix transcriptional regulator [Pseudomonadota bacterium]